MKKLLFLSACILACSQSFALLSPLSQSIREIEAIVSSKEIPQLFLQNDTIQEIEREGNFFVIKAEDKQVVVEVVYLKSDRVGPKEFKLVFHQATSLKQ